MTVRTNWAYACERELQIRQTNNWNNPIHRIEWILCLTFIWSCFNRKRNGNCSNQARWILAIQAEKNFEHEESESIYMYNIENIKLFLSLFLSFCECCDYWPIRSAIMFRKYCCCCCSLTLYLVLNVHNIFMVWLNDGDGGIQVPRMHFTLFIPSRWVCEIERAHTVHIEYNPFAQSIMENKQIFFKSHFCGLSLWTRPLLNHRNGKTMEIAVVLCSIR